MMTDLERAHQARDQYDSFMKSFPSKQAVQEFLFERANNFLAEKSAKTGNGNHIVVPRKQRRKVAREIAKRLTKAAKNSEVL